jgi:hypothetical protein
VAYSPDGQQVFGRDSQGKVLTWDAATGRILPDAAADIPAGRSFAAHGNHRACADGFLIRIERILTAREQQSLLQEEQRMQRLLYARATLEHHTTEASAAEKGNEPFTAVFHIDRLLPLLPDERGRLLARRTAVLTAVLKKTPGDGWATRALARQVIGDPASVPDRKDLLPTLAALAKRSDTFSHRLRGAVLLRTGSAKDAITALQTALEKRGPDGPPVEELLLALAHTHLKQPAAARKQLAIAVAWMHGSEPVRAASLAGLAAPRALTALAGLAVTPPDPRLVPLDPQTAHELTALRGEVEKALAGQEP